jgi:hypothetical protein
VEQTKQVIGHLDLCGGKMMPNTQQQLAALENSKWSKGF